MTFCLGITVEEGLVAIADTRIMAGNKLTTAQKISTYNFDNGLGAFFMMASGLRSVRDKVMTYFDEEMSSMDEPFDKMYKAVNALAGKMRQVSHEDKQYIEQGGLRFDIHILMGGQLQNDAQHQLFLIYPEGNWVIITQGTPYHIIGESEYGKPILDRTLKYSDNLPLALKVGCLAFDSTRISASDVDFPVDVVLYYKNSSQLVEHRYQKDELREISNWWQERLRALIQELPSEWIDEVASRLTMVKKKTRPGRKSMGGSSG